MLDRILSVLVAVSLALLVWLYARSRDQEILDNVTLPVEVSLSGAQAEQYSLELPPNPQVTVSFTGSPARIRELRGIVQRNELRVELSLNIPDDRLHEVRYSDTLHVETRDVHAPPGVSVLVSENGNRIPVTVQRMIEKRLPVRFDHGDDSTGPVLIEPNTVLVRGPAEVLERAREIRTQPSMLPQPTHAALGGATGRVPLVQELEGRPVRVTPNRVTVRVPLQNRKLYELADVPIQFLTPANFLLRPQFLDDRAGKVTLTVQGPPQDSPPHVYAFVDLTAGGFRSGLNHEPLQVQLPHGFLLAKEPARVVSFELLPADFIPRGLDSLPPP
jgi:hypothetical protein